MPKAPHNLGVFVLGFWSVLSSIMQGGEAAARNWQVEEFRAGFVRWWRLGTALCKWVWCVKIVFLVGQRVDA